MYRVLLLFFCFFPIICKEINPYKVLNVPKKATIKEIKKAYKRLARTWHPDKNDESMKAKCTEKMAEISEAYEILKDPKRKKDYDDKQRRHKRNPWRFAQADTDGIGIRLTRYNYKPMMGIDDKPWLVFIYSTTSCRTCETARALFEDVCVQLTGMLRCARLNMDEDYTFVVNTLGVRRVPQFFVRQGDKKNQFSFKKSFNGAHIKNQIDQIYNKNDIQLITNFRQMESFLERGVHLTRAVVFSEKRDSPHIFLRHLAHVFSGKLRLGFVKTQNRDLLQQMKTKLGVENDGSVLVVVNSVKPMADWVEHQEIALDIFKRDCDGLVEAVKSRIEPDLPMLDYENFADLCYKNYDRLDSEQSCFVFLYKSQTFDSKIADLVSKLQSDESFSARTAAVNCMYQEAFCKKLNFKGRPMLAGLAGHMNKFYAYGGELEERPVSEFINRFSISIDDYNCQTGIPFPEEQLDAFTKAFRNLNSNTQGVQSAANLMANGISGVFGSMWWLMETFVSVLLTLLIPMILFGSLFIQRI